MNEPKNLVLDFDCTLSEKHLFHSSHGPSNECDKWMHGSPDPRKGYKRKFYDPYCHNPFNCDYKVAKCKYDSFDDNTKKEFSIWIMGGVDRILLLEKFFTNLTEAGINIHIATYSEPERVFEILKNVKLDHFFFQIYNPSYHHSSMRMIVSKAYVKNGSVVEEYSPPLKPVKAIKCENTYETISYGVTKKCKLLLNIPGIILFVDDSLSNNGVNYDINNKDYQEVLKINEKHIYDHGFTKIVLGQDIENFNLIKEHKGLELSHINKIENYYGIEFNRPWYPDDPLPYAEMMLNEADPNNIALDANIKAADKAADSMDRAQAHGRTEPWVVRQRLEDSYDNSRELGLNAIANILRRGIDHRYRGGFSRKKGAGSRGGRSLHFSKRRKTSRKKQIKHLKR